MTTPNIIYDLFAVKSSGEFSFFTSVGLSATLKYPFSLGFQDPISPYFTILPAVQSRSPLLEWCTFFSLLYFLIGGKLLYNVVLVSAIQQCKSVIILYIYELSSLSNFPPLPHPTPLGHHRELS